MHGEPRDHETAQRGFIGKPMLLFELDGELLPLTLSAPALVPLLSVAERLVLSTPRQSGVRIPEHTIGDTMARGLLLLKI